jgi:NAD(P)-dependent dehydrogenase (short-subunit alcohol dehydrogenase family)
MDTPLQGRRALVTGSSQGTGAAVAKLLRAQGAAVWTNRPVAPVSPGRAGAFHWKTIPSSTLVTLEDLAVPAESQRFMAARAKSQTVEIGASHAATVSEPDAVADLILAAVRETQR